MPIEYIDRAAILSPCKKYRYTLWREWASGQGSIAFVGYNPSVADGTRDDKTIEQCVFFALREGFQKLWMVNLFALRSKEPTAVRVDWAQSVGPDNDHHVKDIAVRAHKIVAAWGNLPPMGRDQTVLSILRAWKDVYCLGLTKQGNPLHPSRLPHDTPLRLFYRKKTSLSAIATEPPSE